MNLVLSLKLTVGYVVLLKSSAHELESVGVGVLAEEEEPAEHAELNTSETAAEHEAVGGELGDPEFAHEVTITSEGEWSLDLGKSVLSSVFAAYRASVVGDADTGKNEADEHGNTSATEADVEAHGERATEQGHAEANGVNEVHGEVVLEDGGPASSNNLSAITTKSGTTT